MLSRESLAANRQRLRARAVGLKPASVELRRTGQTARTFVARVNYPQAGSASAQNVATDAEIVALTIVSDDPALDILREDRVICIDATTQLVARGRVIAVRREPWGVEADVDEAQ